MPNRRTALSHLLLLLTFISGWVGGTPVARAQDLFLTYNNARFGYSLLYPGNLVQARPEAANGDGRLFASTGGSIRLLVYGSHNVNRRSLEQEMRAAMEGWKRRGARVTYARWKDNWLALSGFIGNEIFYQKTIARRGDYATLVWRYPRELRKPLDNSVTRTVQTLAFTAPPSEGAAPTRPQPKPAPQNPGY